MAARRKRIKKEIDPLTGKPEAGGVPTFEWVDVKTGEVFAEPTDVITKERRAAATALPEPQRKEELQRLIREKEGLQPLITEEQKGELVQVAEEREVFKQPVIEPIVPEGERKGAAGVLTSIFTSILGGRPPEGRTSDAAKLQKKLEKGRDLAAEELLFLEESFKGQVRNEMSIEIDLLIDEAEEGLTQFGVGAVVGIVGGLILAPILGTIAESIGDNKKVAFLDTALSQYTEMIPTVTSGYDSGLIASTVYDKLDRIEAGLLLLESELKLASIKSSNVQVSLKDMGIERRILKIREKIQTARLQVFEGEAARAFGEVPITRSLAFVESLQGGKEK